MVIDKICKGVKGVKSKSESFFSISHGVLELWRKNLRGRIPPPTPSPGMDRVNNIVRSMCTFLLLQKIICPASAERILDKTFCLSPFSDTGQQNKRFINIKNHVFGHVASFVQGCFYESL